MEIRNLLADISRQFLKDKKVTKYRMKKIDDMNDDEIISCCHRFCEENKLTQEFYDYREKTESEYCYCSYLEEYIEYGCCYDLQMVLSGFVKKAVFPEIQIEKIKMAEHCSECRHCL